MAQRGFPRTSTRSTSYPSLVRKKCGSKFTQGTRQRGLPLLARTQESDSRRMHEAVAKLMGNQPQNHVLQYENRFPYCKYKAPEAEIPEKKWGDRRGSNPSFRLPVLARTCPKLLSPCTFLPDVKIRRWARTGKDGKKLCHALSCRTRTSSDELGHTQFIAGRSSPTGRRFNPKLVCRGSTSELAQRGEAVTYWRTK
jgi:hypothetical protein